MRNWPAVRKIAVVDTGDEGADRQTAFEQFSIHDEDPVDAIGHGTSVGSLIRLAARGHKVHSLRVLQSGERLVRSSMLLDALSEATGSGADFQVVCIPQRAEISTEERRRVLGLQRILHQQDNSGFPTPVVVCAAGNGGRGQSMSFPALVPGVVVARALTWAGDIASYNCALPHGANLCIIGAFGGVETDPMGTRARIGKPVTPLFGSSYAASLIAASVACAGA